MPPPTNALDGLNAAQRAAAEAVRGPVAIVAGAGTGKTTTITARIAHQVASGTFGAGQILAVTFTEKAARELQHRLAGLGVEGVQARTFHSAALSQLSGLWSTHTGEALPAVLDHKAPLIASLANALPPPHKFLPRRELAGEIEWAKNRMIPPERYLASLGEHEPPIPAELMHRVYEGYERRKRTMGRLDFEDMLGLNVRLLDEYPAAAEQVRARFHAFTVDEFQDVNPLQAALLDRWLGEREDLCVVGDDYQTIYAFTGASPEHLLQFTRRFPGATVVRLEENYRSTPEVLEVANRLATSMGGFRKTLRATRPSGPAPVLTAVADDGAEVDAVVAAVRKLHDEESVPLEQIAVLYRINARSEPFEEAFAAAHIPYQVRDGAFLGRPGPRSVLQRLKRAGGAVDEAVARDHRRSRLRPGRPARCRRGGHAPGRSRPAPRARHGVHARPSGRGCRRVRRGAVGAILGRAQRARREPIDLSPSEGSRVRRGVPAAVAGRGAAVPVRTIEGRPRGGAAPAVRGHHARPALPVPDLADRREGCAQPVPGRVGRRAAGAGPSPRAAPGVDRRGRPLFDRLKGWRRKRAEADGVPAYVVFSNKTLEEIAARKPRDWADLAAVSGVGPAKLERYGDEVLAIVSSE